MTGYKYTTPFVTSHVMPLVAFLMGLEINPLSINLYLHFYAHVDVIEFASDTVTRYDTARTEGSLCVPD